jgi:hypothetical protein
MNKLVYEVTYILFTFVWTFIPTPSTNAHIQDASVTMATQMKPRHTLQKMDNLNEPINILLDLMIMLKNMQIFAITIKCILKKHYHFLHPYNSPLSYMSTQ